MGDGDYDGKLHQLQVRKATIEKGPGNERDALRRMQRPQRSSKAGWIYFFVSLFVVLPILTGAVFTIMRLAYRASETSSSPTSFRVQETQEPHLPAARYVEPTPGGPDVKLREDFDERSGWPSQGRILSQAGYPIMVVLKEAPACGNPYQVKEALDAVRSGDLRWLDGMPGCELIEKSVVAEWISNPYKHLETIAMRLALPDGSRKTVYAPSNNPDVGIEAWFGHRYRE